MTMSRTKDYSGRDVLIIEDDDFQRGLVAQALQVIGFTVIREAGDGEAGIRECMTKLPDLILCDIEMQPMDGLAFLRALRRTKSMAVRSIPIIFLTSHADSTTVRDAVKTGVDGFIVKPPTLKSLKDRIDSVFAKHAGKI